MSVDGVEFGVVNVACSKSHVTVEGRCHRGPIFPGSTFTVLSEVTVYFSPEVVGPATSHPIGAVELNVESIWAYGHQIDELSPGMTARLELSGIGADQIVPGFVLT